MTDHFDWRGAGRVCVANPGALSGPGKAAAVEPAGLPCRSEDDTWGRSVVFQKNDLGKRRTVWIEFDVPDDPGLVGRRLDLALELDVERPMLVEGRLENRSDHLEETTSVTIAPPGAARTYRSAWIIGWWLSVALTIAGDKMLRRAARAYGASGRGVDAGFGR